MSTADRAVGAVLEGRYRLEARLSHWGVGECWRAVDTQRPRASVTVKILPAPSGRRTERMAALKLLGDRLTKLQHPNNLPIIEVNTSGAQPLVVYDAWESVGLGEWLASVRAAGDATQLRTVFGVADRLLAAVGAGHRQRSPGALIHGALHHEAARVRIEVGRDPEVRVIDVGLSAEKDAAALVDSSPSEYGAPEHVREPSLRNAATDVFAAAVLVLRLLVPDAARPRGHRSWAHFVAQKESEVHAAITALRADVDPSIWAALAQALARRPEARPADAERLREMLRAASWGASASVSLAVEEPLAPLVPMELPSLQPLAPPVPALSLATPPLPVVHAPPPVVAHAPPPSTPAGPPPVPKGMQLGVGSVLGAGRPDAPPRPRRSTAGLDGHSFGAPPSAPTRPAKVSLDDAAATTLDPGFPAAPSALSDLDAPTALVALPEGPHAGKISLADAERTELSPFDAPDPTRVGPLPVPAPSSGPSRLPHGEWSEPSWGSQPSVVSAPFPAPVSLAAATQPISLEAAPPPVVAALAAYAAPVHPSAWDSAPHLQPVAFQAPPAAPPTYAAPPRAPADPFAMVAAAGRVDARPWDASSAPPALPPNTPRKTPVALFVALALFVAVAAFLLGLVASSRSPDPAPTPTPVVR